MRKIGALWKQKSKKDNKVFLSGKVEFISGLQTQIIVLPNDKTKSKNPLKAPDYNVCLSDPYDPEGKPKQVLEEDVI